MGRHREVHWTGICEPFLKETVSSVLSSHTIEVVPDYIVAKVPTLSVTRPGLVVRWS